MIRQNSSRRQKTLLGLASVAILILSYSLLSMAQHRKNPSDTTLPGLKQLVEGVGRCIRADKRSGERWLVVDSKATLTRLALGLAAGVSGALVIGLLMGCFSQIEGFFMPPLTFLALIPPTAALAVYFVIAGTGMAMYVAMIGLGIGATLARSVYLSVQDVPAELLYKAYTLGASRAEIVFEVIFRLILPRFINAVRLHIAPAMIFLIAAEMVVGDAGFGYRIRLQSRLLNMNVVYPYLMVLAAFGFAIDVGLRKLQQFMCPWFSPGRS